MQRLLRVWLLFLVIQSKLISGATYLRTAMITRGTPSELDWLSNSARRRQLLGHSECNDARWGPLCGKMQLLLQLADGYTSQDAARLVSQLHANGAFISSSLPENTWLVLASEDSLNPAAYKPHHLAPYSPEYKLAPEWHPVLELIEQQQQQTEAAGASHHLQVHKRILAHSVLEHLTVADTAQHLRHTAAAAAADAAVRHELKQQAPGKVLIGVHFPEIPAADLARTRVNPSSFNPASAAASDWEQQLRAVVMASERSSEHQQLCQPEFAASSPWELNVAVCPQDLSEVLYWLSKQALVHWLAPRPRLYYQNSAASKIIQASTTKTASHYTQPESHVFWNAGLDGTGEIVGIGDSGIDMDSCFFSDPAVPFVAPVAGKEWANPQHRKVVYYWGLADDSFRDLVGHGTHTSGSVAGFNPAAPDSKATGAAKGARLAFVDLSRTAGGDVNAPQDLERNYFPKMYDKGACIFTDSWGSTSPVYDFQASKLDSWLYNNQDCISHFAAGNYGENDNLDSTITSPATAKNTVTVGATKSFVPNYLSQTIAPVFEMSVEIKRANKPAQYVGVRLVKADFGGDGASLSNKGLRLARASPDTACSTLVGAPESYANTILLVKRGSCYFSQKLAAGAAAGVAAVVIINDKAGGYFKMDAQDNPGASGTIPLFAVTRRTGMQLWSFFDAQPESIAGTIERYAQGWPAYEDIASFSSFGPTADNRIKPDIVAPGELVSAASGDSDGEGATCNIGRKSGTSMATPMAAGHTAIIRQYFRSGFYPTGAPGNAAYLPSGPLMKAVMLGGACEMQGNTEQYLPLDESPSMRQGFGRFCLCNALKLAGNCTTNMQLVDRVPITSQESHKYCVRTTGGDVRVTLTWYDYPAQVSAEKTLVNDLDLTVVSAGMGGQTFYGNMEAQKDDVNTVERILLRNVPPGGLDITVSAGQLSPNTKSQNYSLVVQGEFADTLNSPYNPDPAAGKTLAGCTPELIAQPAAVQTAPVPVQQPLPTATAAVIEEKGSRNDSSATAALSSSTVAAAAAAAATSTLQPAAAAAAPTAAAPVAPAAAAAVPTATAAVPAAAVPPATPDAAAAAAAAAAATHAAAAQQAAAAQAAAAAEAAATQAAAAAQAAATQAAATQAAAAAAAAAAAQAAAAQATAQPAVQPAAAVPPAAVAQPIATAPVVEQPAAAQVQPVATAPVAVQPLVTPLPAVQPAATTPAAVEPAAVVPPVATTPVAAAQPAATAPVAVQPTVTPAAAAVVPPTVPAAAVAPQATVPAAATVPVAVQSVAKLRPGDHENQASLVNALIATMGRRLTWAPTTPTMPAWMRDSNMSIVVKVPTLVCRWINATAKRAAAASFEDLAAEGLITGTGPARILQAAAPAAADTAHDAVTMLLIPLQHLALAGLLVLLCVVLLSVGMRQYQINRDLSLSSSVRKDLSLNKAMGRAPTGDAALLKALLDDPTLAEHVSPTKRAALGLPISPFEGATASFTGRSSNSSSCSLRNGNSSGWMLTATHSGAATPPSGKAGVALPYEPLRVRLGRLSAAGASLPGPCRPMSVPPGCLLPAAHSTPLPVTRSAPVSPAYSVVTSPSESALSMGGPDAGTECGSELRVVVRERGVGRVSDSMLPPPGAPISPDLQRSRRGIHRCSHSFTFGNSSGNATEGQEGHLEGCEVFGLGEGNSSSREAEQRLHFEQLRCKSQRSYAEQQHAVLRVHQQAHEVLLPQWAPAVVPHAAAGAGAALQAGAMCCDAGRQRDQ